MTGRNCKCGDFVLYVPSLTEYVVTPEESGYRLPQVFNPSTNTLWRVFREATADNENIVLLSHRSIGSLTLEGKVGFAKSVGTLNRLCNAYADPKFAVSGQSIGSTERSITELEMDTCSCDWMMTASSAEKQNHSDNEYYDDLNWLRYTGLMRKSDRYVWLASRHAEEASIFHAMDFSMPVWNGCKNNKEMVCLYKAYREGGGYDYQATYAVRPKIVLRGDVQLIDGDGSKTKPYILKV